MRLGGLGGTGASLNHPGLAPPFRPQGSMSHSLHSIRIPQGSNDHIPLHAFDLKGQDSLTSGTESPPFKDVHAFVNPQTHANAFALVLHSHLKFVPLGSSFDIGLFFHPLW